MNIILRFAPRENVVLTDALSPLLVRFMLCVCLCERDRERDRDREREREGDSETQ